MAPGIISYHSITKKLTVSFLLLNHNPAAVEKSVKDTHVVAADIDVVGRVDDQTSATVPANVQRTKVAVVVVAVRVVILLHARKQK